MSKAAMSETEVRDLLLSGQLVRVREAAVLTGLCRQVICRRVKLGDVRAFGTKPMLVALPDLLKRKVRRGGRKPGPQMKHGY